MKKLMVFGFAAILALTACEDTPTEDENLKNVPKIGNLDGAQKVAFGKLINAFARVDYVIDKSPVNSDPKKNYKSADDTAKDMSNAVNGNCAGSNVESDPKRQPLHQELRIEGTKCPIRYRMTSETRWVNTTHRVRFDVKGLMSYKVVDQNFEALNDVTAFSQSGRSNISARRRNPTTFDINMSVRLTGALTSKTLGVLEAYYVANGKATAVRNSSGNLVANYGTETHRYLAKLPDGDWAEFRTEIMINGNSSTAKYFVNNVQVDPDDFGMVPNPSDDQSELVRLAEHLVLQ